MEAAIYAAFLVLYAIGIVFSILKVNQPRPALGPGATVIVVFLQALAFLGVRYLYLH